MTLKYKQILVAVDGSTEAQLAFKKSIGIAERNHAGLNLVYVVDPRSYTAIKIHEPLIEQDIFTYGNELLDKYKSYAQNAGIENVNTFVTLGSPKKIIARDVAKQVEADLIVCGASGINAFDRLMLGSVSQHIVRSSSCDVLVVRSDVDDEPHEEIK